MKIRKVHHVAVICTDYNVSKDFYVNKLGFEVIHEFYRAERDSYKLDLAVGDHTQIELFSFPSPPDRPSSQPRWRRDTDTPGADTARSAAGADPRWGPSLPMSPDTPPQTPPAPTPHS